MLVAANQTHVAASCRTTVTLPLEDHGQLTRIAEAKRVSIGWVVRDAVRQYLDQQAPLLRSVPHNGQQ